MSNLLYLILFSSAMGILSVDKFDQLPWFFGFMRRHFIPASICINSTTQAGYLAKMNILINRFQKNSTYNAVLEIESPIFVSYVKDPSNQALLYSNCMAFVDGVKTAKLADKAAALARKKIAREIHLRFRHVSTDLTANEGPNELDSNEKLGHH
ncbi:unnamed protein product [Rotaria socialis]|uniref:Uncharacterized protein n=2 Tax=Rotaria socialis TaxID=392032 RepID=A0A817VDR1_9BILA|nr:unnamed protein product [Rotaria socialis]CAF3338642.1 unnamed protein product [Rotaria socialis]CAF3465573.1 unnamed protein product [Rotaria socialis]CAF3598724.1 unnamed protein product [Rotaria socialis]CAF3645391.1 unnamed protein product [Rotaria socialis]